MEDEMRKMWMLLLVAAVAASVYGGVAWATAGSGITANVTLARGTTPHFKLKLRDVPGPTDVVVQHITVAPGGFTGWHTHPGPAIVVIQSGQITLYDGPSRGGDDGGDGEGDHASHEGGGHASCVGTTYTAGQLFVDPGYGHVHIGRNEGSSVTELYTTYLQVPVGASQRIDVASPGNCPF
jgi:hypothetical protein